MRKQIERNDFSFKNAFNLVQINQKTDTSVSVFYVLLNIVIGERADCG